MYTILLYFVLFYSISSHPICIYISLFPPLVRLLFPPPLRPQTPPPYSQGPNTCHT